MRPGYDEHPLNPVPPVVWLLALPLIASEAVFALGQMGFIGGGQGAGAVLRQLWVERTAFAPEFLARIWTRGTVDGQIHRLITYPFVHYSVTHALFVGVFLLALGNMVARAIRPVGVAVIFFGASVAGALVYTILAGLLPTVRFGPLVGGYPGVYGLLGGFTFLLWTRLGQEQANRLRAFALIGMLLVFQLVFGLLFGNAGYAWVAEITGFAAGFGLSFLLVPGGWRRVRAQIRHR
jgi:membrane associated rhomboid family serine protease